MLHVNENIEECNSGRKCNLLIVFDDRIADMISNKTINQIVTELFIRRKKLNISSVFITKCYFQVPKTVKINCTYFFIIKVPNQKELSEIVFKQLCNLSVYLLWSTLEITEHCF